MMKTLLGLLLCLLASTPSLAAEREHVLGFGGFFFKANDQQALIAWYEEHLGVKRTPSTYEEEPWQQQGGTTIFGVFAQSSTYFGDPEQQWMINFRVRDLDAMVAQLQAAGIEVDVDPNTYPNGRFARLEDPEGNPIQLWQEYKITPPEHEQVSPSS
ncbi:MAG: VOC family protein [Aliidiomarina sp.]|uniref:VOC family protein n=1 Tax=Aliidiomarina sp. TaxID=1872439 RepID=UPI0025C52D9C|nr:VOC family protein [Aliidiomarina sp.]MCH8500442.1 VOC family protein [Aliidiomarina sp.]